MRNTFFVSKQKVQPKIKSPRKNSAGVIGGTPKGSPARTGAPQDTKVTAAKEAARKNRLKEAKKLQAAKLAADLHNNTDATDGDGVTIFVSTQGKEFEQQ